MSVIIIGGGATGLISAYLAAKRGEQVVLLEASERLGGLLKTFPIGETRLECFYHHFFTHDREILWLLSELGLKEDIRFIETEMGVYRKGKLHPFSGSVDLLRFPNLSLIDKIRFGLTSIFLAYQEDKQKYESIPAMEWFYKWAGKNATDAIWRPMMEIKFGEYANQVPVLWMIGRMRQRIRSRDQGNEKLGYLKGSLQRLVDRLESELVSLNVKVLKSSSARDLRIENGEIKGVEIDEGMIEGDRVLVTIPSSHFAHLIPSSFGNYKEFVEGIEYFGAICVVVITRDPLSSTYWINVADPGFEFGGIIEQTNLVPREEYSGQNVTYLSRYLTKESALFKISDDEVSRIFIDQLSSVFPSLLDPGNLQEVKVFKSKTAAPVCGLNFSKSIPNMKTPIQGLYIANMTHVYPDERSVNNSTKVALEIDKIMFSG